MNLRAILPTRRRRQPPPVSAGLALVGLAAGAAAVALLEPRSGARRRALVVQKATHAMKAARTFGEKAVRDLENRSRGLLAEARSSIRETSVPDEVLVERVRSRIGRLTSHAGAIEVFVREGAVELRGPILEGEADWVLEGTRRIRGVREVIDRLDRHAQPGDVPGLRGGAGRPGPVPEIMQQHWAPGTRLLAMLVGAGLVLGGLRTRRPAGLTMGAIGALLALRGATNQPWKRLLGTGARRRAVGLHETTHIEAPREEVRPEPPGA